MREDGTINLLDYGCIRVFDSGFVRGIIDLYHAVRDEDRDLAVHAYETWGFSDLSNEMVEALNIWANYIYGPLIDDRVRMIDESGNAHTAARSRPRRTGKSGASAASPRRASSC